MDRYKYLIVYIMDGVITNTVCKLSPDSLLRNNFIVNVRMIVCVCVGVSRDTVSFQR